MNEAALIVIMVVFLLVALFVISQFLFRRALSAVIRIFRQNGAIGVNSALTVEELGLKPKSLFQRIGGPRDYKLMAMDVLLRDNIIQITEDGKLYLSEGKLAASKLK